MKTLVFIRHILNLIFHSKNKKFILPHRVVLELFWLFHITIDTNHLILHLGKSFTVSIFINFNLENNISKFNNLIILHKI